MEDVPTVGGKCASLGEMRRAGLRVPPGFAVTVKTYRDFLAATGLQERLEEALRAIAAGSRNGRSRPGYHDASDAVAKVFESVQMPDDVRDSIVRSYRASLRHLRW